MNGNMRVPQECERCFTGAMLPSEKTKTSGTMRVQGKRKPYFTGEAMPHSMKAPNTSIPLSMLLASRWSPIDTSANGVLNPRSCGAPMEVLLLVEGKGGWLELSPLPHIMSMIPAAKNIIDLDHYIVAI